MGQQERHQQQGMRLEASQRACCGHRLLYSLMALRPRGPHLLRHGLDVEGRGDAVPLPVLVHRALAACKPGKAGWVGGQAARFLTPSSTAITPPTHAPAHPPNSSRCISCPQHHAITPTRPVVEGFVKPQQFLQDSKTHAHLCSCHSRRRRRRRRGTGEGTAPPARPASTRSCAEGARQRQVQQRRRRQRSPVGPHQALGPRALHSPSACPPHPLASQPASQHVRNGRSQVAVEAQEGDGSDGRPRQRLVEPALHAGHAGQRGSAAAAAPGGLSRPAQRTQAGRGAGRQAGRPRARLQDAQAAVGQVACQPVRAQVLLEGAQ